MKKRISVLLFITTFLLLFTACGARISKIEDYEWKMRIVMRSAEETFSVVAVGETDDAYPDAKLVDLTLIAKNGTLTISDITNNKNYTGTYKLIDTALESNHYEVTIDGISGFATVSMTEYDNGNKEATMPVNLGEFSLYFYEK